MFLCSLIEELCTKEENNKTDCNFNFGQHCVCMDKYLHVMRVNMIVFKWHYATCWSLLHEFCLHDYVCRIYNHVPKIRKKYKRRDLKMKIL